MNRRFTFDADAANHGAVTPDSAIAAGSPARAAIAALVERHGPMLHALSLRFCGNRADAEDLVQDVFIQAFRKWHTFRGESDAGTWLYAIAARSCSARRRRKGGVDRHTPAMSQLTPWGERTVMQIAAAPEGDEDPAERAEALERVRAAIARLPEHLRMPLVLKEVLGVSVDDAASTLGLAANTVKTRLHRARLALRKAMVAGAPSVAASAPIYERQVCLDLLKAKMDAMDRGAGHSGAAFKIPQAEVCARCRAVFRELDLVHDACSELAAEQLPPKLRAVILNAIGQRDAAEESARGRPGRGRRPVAASASKAPR